MRSLAIITTHPIQYNAPLFRYISHSGLFNIKVFYTWGEDSLNVFDPGFGHQRSWDIDLLNGYESVFVKNVSSKPGSHHYKGIVNPDLNDLVSAFKPDAILVFGWKFDSHLKLMIKFKGKVPILFRGDSTLLDETIGFSFKKVFRLFVLKWIYSHVDYVLSPGTASDNYFKAAGLKLNQIVRAKHAIDISRFGQSHSEAHSWRKSLGIPSDDVVFLFAGKFEQKKDPVLLLNTFISFHHTHPDTHLVMTGSGELKSILDAEIQTKGSQSKSNIHFTGFVNQSLMPALYELADIFVLPSKGPGETWGLSVNEAMASGRAVIVSNKCGCAEDLVSGQDVGYIFQSGSAQSLHDAMVAIIQNNRYRGMGEIAREKIASFSYADFLFALEKTIS